MSQIDLAPFLARTRQIEISADKWRASERRQDTTDFRRFTCNEGLHCLPRLVRFRSLLGQLPCKGSDQLAVGFPAP